MKIRWLYCGEAGYWHSNEGRFDIAPGGFRHGVTPDFFELRDGLAKPEKRNTKHDTVAAAKSEALNVAIRDAKFAGALHL